MFASASDYGPFAPVVGYAGAIMAAGGALLMLFAGKLKKWRPPNEDLPGAAQSLILLLCGVGMVLQWYLATPTTVAWVLGGVALLAVLCVMCFFRYNGLLGIHRYDTEVHTSGSSTRIVPILGGRQLKPDAQKKLEEEGIDIQSLLAGAAYKPDKLWTRESRQWVKQRVLLFFIFTLVLGTSALTGASFATQVLLTQKAAASVIRTEEAPGLK